MTSNCDTVRMKIYFLLIAPLTVYAVSPQCETYLRTVAFSYSSFDACALLRARPFSVCTKCFNEYSEAYNTYVKLENGKGASEKNCSDDLLSGDRVSIIHRDFQHLTGTWALSNCDSCLQVTRKDREVSFSISPSTVKFESLAKDVTKCIDEQSMNSSKICQGCSQQYQNLSDFYAELNGLYEGRICMDILDTMNETRVEWSKYQCNAIYRLDLEFWCYAVTLILLTVVFYVAARFSQNPKAAMIIEGRSMRDHMFKLFQSQQKDVPPSEAPAQHSINSTNIPHPSVHGASRKPTVVCAVVHDNENRLI